MFAKVTRYALVEGGKFDDVSCVTMSTAIIGGRKSIVVMANELDVY